ncbi:MAG: hypothetical protein KBS85_07175 [Lachnospiraceae bacterium]|nr:hypothetical protein [Candidatus Merdinaster equi]
MQRNSITGKLIVFALAIALILASVACGNSDNQSNSQNDTESATQNEGQELGQNSEKTGDGEGSEQPQGAQQDATQNAGQNDMASDYVLMDRGHDTALIINPRSGVSEVVSVSEIAQKAKLLDSVNVNDLNIIYRLDDILVIAYHDLDGLSYVDAYDIKSNGRANLITTRDHIWGIDAYKGCIYITLGGYVPEITDVYYLYENKYTITATEDAPVILSETSEGSQFLNGVPINNICTNTTSEGSYISDSVARSLDEYGFFVGYGADFYAPRYFRVYANGDKEEIALDDKEVYPCGFDKDNLYYIQYDIDEGKRSLWCHSISNGTDNLLCDEDPTILYAKEGICFAVSERINAALVENHIYYYSPEKGTIELFAASSGAGYANTNPGVDGFTVIGGVAYYLAVSDSNSDSDSESNSGPDSNSDSDKKGVYEWYELPDFTEGGQPQQTGIISRENSARDLGNLEAMTFDYECPYCGNRVGQYYAEKLVVDPQICKDDQIAAIYQQINSLVENQESEWETEYISANVIDDDLYCDNHDGLNGYVQSACWTFGNVKKVFDHYIQIRFDVLFFGGNKSQISDVRCYLLDTDTGKQAGINQIFDISENEFKTLAAECTLEELETDNAYQYEGLSSEQLYELAYENASFDMQMSFEEDGLHLSYDLFSISKYPFPFIGGVIPYDRLGME